VQNPKELQDLQLDVVSLKNHLAALEDRLLEAMLAMDEANKGHKNAQAALKTAQDRWAQQNLELQAEQSELQKELQKLALERDALAGTISEGNVRLYDQLRQQRRGVAVAGISDNTCNACGSTLTPAQAQAVRSAIEMARCPSCGRILYGN
jgi:predicted  nucleic acid-binding Zn-ribbon protein